MDSETNLYKEQLEIYIKQLQSGVEECNNDILYREELIRISNKMIRMQEEQKESYLKSIHEATERLNSIEI